MPDPDYLALSALFVRGDEASFTGHPPERGVHLRWSFPRQAGPPDEFVVRGGFQPGGEGFELARLSFPESEAEAWARVAPEIARLGDRVLENRYRRAAHDLVRLLDEQWRSAPADLPYHCIRAPRGEPSANARMPLPEMLELGCLDPYVARMLGLYWVHDSDSLHGESATVYYTVVGQWGSRRWPSTRIDFSAASVTAGQDGYVAVDGVELGMRRCYITRDDFYQRHLVAGTDSSLLLEVRLPEPGEEVRFELGDTSGSWTASADYGPATVTVAGNELVIKADDRFETLLVAGPPRPWHIGAMEWTRESGAIGEISSLHTAVVYGGATERVPRPALERLVATGVPATLDPDTGRVATTSSQVELEIDAETYPDDPFRPVRLLVERAEESSAGWEPLTRADGRPSPIVYAAASGEPVLPELAAYWPLEGHARNLKSGEDARAHGPTSFPNGTPAGAVQPVLELASGAHVEAAATGTAGGAELTVEALVFADGDEAEMTVLDDGGFRLGLERGSDGDYAVRLGLTPSPGAAEESFAGASSIPRRRWTQVCATYDGESVRLYVDGEQIGFHPAAHGPVGDNTRGRCVIGGVQDGTSLFRGRLAEVRVWQQRLHPDEARDRLEQGQHALGSQTSRSALVGAWLGLVEFREADAQREVFGRPELYAPGSELTVEAWVRPAEGAHYATLVGNHYSESFWLGLMAQSAGYLPRFWLKGVSGGPSVFHGSTPLPLDQWSRVAVTYDGAHVRFYVDGREDAVHAADFGAIAPNPRRTLTLGAGYEPMGDSVDFLFHGDLADVRIWNRAVAPAQAAQALTGTQYIDRPVEDGRWSYRTRGVDLFGRLSDWSAAVDADVRDELPPVPPVDVHGRFVQAAGRITSAAAFEITAELPAFADLGSERLSILGARASDEGETVLARLAGCDLEILREVTDSEGERRHLSQSVEIVRARLGEVEGSVVFEARRPSLPRFQPDAGDRVVLGADMDLEVSWAMTGMQRLFYPRARECRIYVEEGPLRALRGRATQVEELASGRFRVTADASYSGPAELLEGQWCQIDSALYKVLGHDDVGDGLRLEVEYLARPVIAPREADLVILNLPASATGGRDWRRPEDWSGPRFVEPLRERSAIEASSGDVEASRLSTSKREELAEAGVHWLPDGVYRFVMPDGSAPDGFEPAVVDSFVPGALVAQRGGGESARWEAFNVVWEALEENDLVLYVQYHDAEAAPGVEPEGGQPQDLKLANPRYYRGEHYRTVRPLPLPHDEPTREWKIGLTTADDRTGTPDHRGEADRFGNESAVAPIATAVAVNRRRPPIPDAPRIVGFERADYEGAARVQVEWDSVGDGARYQLYRAVDGAVFQRDLEQRRKRTGYYAGKTPAEIMVDDPDFDAWIDDRGVDRTHFFEGPDGPHWNEMTAEWRRWADRYYPGRVGSDVPSVVDLANRGGNEKAFGLVNDTPIDGTSFVDPVDGRVRNRYLYRLRSQSPALVSSAGFGPASAPQRPRDRKPPRAPVFTAVRPGDRRMTLDWAMNQTPDVDHYVLYRAESADELEDLRWFEDGPDQRLVATVDDPRIKATVQSDGTTTAPLPDDIPGDILAAYRIDDIDHDAGAPKPGAYNLLLSSDRDVGVAQLRRVAPQTPIVLMCSSPEGNVLLSRRLPEPPYVDEDVLGLTDYFYRLVAVDTHGNVSRGSKIQRARTLEIEPPEVPPFEITRTADGSGEDRIHIACPSPPPGLEVLIRRQDEGVTRPRTTLDWAELRSGFGFDDGCPSDAALEYTVTVRTTNQNVCVRPARFLSVPNPLVLP